MLFLSHIDEAVVQIVQANHAKMVSDFGGVQSPGAVLL